MSVDRRAGMTQLPSSMPITSSVTWIVRSRSVPVTVSVFPMQESSRPSSTGRNRPAAHGAAGRGQHVDQCVASDLNFTEGPFGWVPVFHVERDICVGVKVVRAVDCGRPPRSLVGGPVVVPTGLCVAGPPSGTVHSGVAADWGRRPGLSPRVRPGPQALPVVGPQAGRRRDGRAQAVPARIFWISSVTCS